jgi:hypothetical protein
MQVNPVLTELHFAGATKEYISVWQSAKSPSWCKLIQESSLPVTVVDRQTFECGEYSNKFRNGFGRRKQNANRLSIF